MIKRLSILVVIILFSIKMFSQNIIIKDINIIPITKDTLLKKQSVLIENGIIKKITNYKQLIKNSNNPNIINGTGKYLMPGLADMHVHLPEQKKVEEALLYNIVAGVTQIRVMNSKISQIELKEKLKNNHNKLIHPNIHFSHLIRENESFTEKQADSLMNYINENGIEFIKLLSLSNQETFDNLTKSAKKFNVSICGHYPLYEENGKTKMIDFEKVIKNNFKSIEHLTGYIWLKDNKQIEKAINLSKQYKTYNCPTLDWDIMAYNLQYPNKYKKRLTYQFLPKKITKNWENNYISTIQKTGEEKVIRLKDKYKVRFEKKLKILKKLYENNCLLLIGGDPETNFQADGFNVYEEMINWSNAGIDNYTILKSATLNASMFFNQNDKWGSIQEGKNAELIILKKNPLENIENITTIETTIIGEKIYNNKELINKL